MRGRGRPSESRAKPAISPPPVSTDADGAKPATRAEVSTDSVLVPRPGRAPSASACEPYRELIIEAVRRGRDAMAIWQDLVDDHLGVPTYRFLRRYLERRPPVPLTLRQVDPLIRQLTLYRDLIDRTTGDQG